MSTPISRFFKRLYAGWMAFARGLAYVNTRVVLFLVYFSLFGFLRLGEILLRRDFLNRHFPGGLTNWVPLPQKARTIEDYGHLF